MREHGCPEHGTAALGALALVTSELVTNSVLHGRPPIIVRLRCRVHEIDLAVADTGTGLPVASIPVLGAGMVTRVLRGRNTH